MSELDGMEIDWQKAQMSPLFMAYSGQMAAAKTVYEANLKKYWPHTYRMYKAMKLS